MYKHTVGFIKPFIIFKVIHFLSLIINTLHANQILNAVLGNNQGLLFWVRKNVLVKMIDSKGFPPLGLVQLLDHLTSAIVYICTSLWFYTNLSI